MVELFDLDDLHEPILLSVPLFDFVRGFAVPLASDEGSVSDPSREEQLDSEHPDSANMELEQLNLRVRSGSSCRGKVFGHGPGGRSSPAGVLGVLQPLLSLMLLQLLMLRAGLLLSGLLQLLLLRAGLLLSW